MRLGQNFLADPNLLDAIVREAEVRDSDVVLEVGAGAGVLTSRLADAARLVHTVEIDRRLEGDLTEIAADPRVHLVWGDAMRMDFGELDPAPDVMVANLPYSVATPVILRTIAGLPSLRRWTVMVQREIADRLRAAPGSRLYGGPSVLVQLATKVKMLRKVDAAVFTPRPRVGSAVISLDRIGAAASPELQQLVRDAFAHRRKALARSLELAKPGRIEAARAALTELGLPADARAERLSPAEFAALGERLAAAD